MNMKLFIDNEKCGEELKEFSQKLNGSKMKFQN